MRVIAFYFKKNVDLQSIGDIFYRYSPQMAMRSGQALFLEVSKSHRLYSEEGILLRARVHLHQLGHSVFTGAAHDVPTALSIAEFNSKTSTQANLQKSDLPIESLMHYISPFQTDLVLEKKTQLMIEHLKNLGLQTLGDFQKLQSPSLISRFGALGRMLFRNVQDASSLVWPSFSPSEKICEEFEFDLEYPVDSTEPLLFQIKSMIDRMYWRLRGQGKRLKRMLLILGLEHKTLKGEKEYSIEIGLTNGIMSPKSIFNILREHLQRSVQVKPLTRRVHSLRIEAIETTPYFENQRDLLNPKKEEEHESYVHLLSRLKVRLGEDAVFSAALVQSYIPEFNWSRSVLLTDLIRKGSSFAEDIGEVPLRPLRVLLRPERVSFQNSGPRNSLFWKDKKVDFLISQNANCFLTKESHLLSQNHEVIFSEWWNGVGERHYFRLKCEQGQDLWLFRAGEEYFVHGMFD